MHDRKSFIGGSDAAAIVGVNPFKTALDVYLEKIGHSKPFEGNRFTEWGNKLEEIIVDTYADKVGCEVRDRQAEFVHPSFDFIKCHVDGVSSRGPLVEAKSGSAYVSSKWGEEGSDQIPDEYLIQCQHNMMLANIDQIDVPVLLGGNDFRVYNVYANKDLQSKILQKELEFWTCVNDRKMPDAQNVDDLALMYAEVKDEIIEADQELEMSIRELAACKSMIKDFEAKKKEAEFKVKKIFADKSIAVDVDGKTLATFKQSKGRAGFDKKSLESDHPEIFAKYATTGKPYRTLLIK